MNAIHQASTKTNELIAKKLRQKLVYKKVGAVDSLGYKDEYGRMIVPQGYDKIIYDVDNATFLVSKNGLWGAFCGYCNGTGKCKHCHGTGK